MTSAFPDSGTAAPASTPETAPVSEAAPAAPPEGTEAGPTQGLIGVTEQPAEAAQPVSTYKLAEGLDPNTVVAVGPNGEALKASDIPDGLLRQADYTRKTQELATIRQQAEIVAQEFPQAAKWITENGQHIGTVAPLVEALATGDQQAFQNALVSLAEQAGVTLPSNRQRDASGRFVAQAEPQDELIDLETLEPGTVAYDMAVRANSLIQKNQALETKFDGVNSKLDKFFGQVETEQRTQQVQAELSGIASEWSGLGLQGVDIAGARKLVGQQINPTQAMQLHHFYQVMTHNVECARKTGRQAETPTTPAALGSQPTVDFSQPFNKAMEEAFR